MEIGFVLKKSLSFMLEPLPILFALLAIALFFQKKYRIWVILAMLLLFLFSFGPFVKTVMAPLEHRYKPLKEIPSGANHIVLLGGDSRQRSWEVLRLYRMQKGLTIIATGYSIGSSKPTALKAKMLLRYGGIKEDEIIVLTRPKDTSEEAKAIKELLGDKEVIIVTSAYHMPRAMMIFQKLGVNAIASPTDFFDLSALRAYGILSTEALGWFGKFWHELLGIAWYRLKEF